MPPYDPYTRPQPGPSPAPYRTLRPAPARPAETAISAPIHHAHGPRRTVLLTSRPIYIDTHARALGIDTPAGYRAYPLTPGRIVIARRDALTLPAWHRLIAGED